MTASASVAGYLGKDFLAKEIPTSNGGNVTIAEGSIATKTKKEQTTWTKIKAIGKSAKIIQKFEKGSFLSISGTPTLETWVDKTTGKIHSALVIQVENFSGSKI